MTKDDLLKAVAKENGISQADANKILGSVSKYLVAGFKKGESLRLNELGTFVVKDRPARTGRNPRNGEAMEIAATRSVGFKLAKPFREEMKAIAAKKKTAAAK